MAIDKTRCPTNVLSDAPTREDAFGHRSVAAAIADLIGTSEGGKAIALAGSWGSGKSSVVEILAEILQQDHGGDVITFVFDAWAHQGDPLRRTFLEQLIDQLTAVMWLEQGSYWVDRKEELARRLQRVTTTSRPVLTTLGGIFAVLVLVAPAGLQLFGKYDPSKFNHPRLATAGLVAALLPFLFAVGAFLWVRPTWKFWTRDFWTKNRFPYDRNNVLTLFMNKSQERTESTTIRTPDPTSLEFQKLFGDILDAALRGETRKLLVVVDNLDRVDAKDALAIWATLKAFFDFDRRRAAGWLGRMWLLVPFDPSALRRLWKESKEEENTEENVAALPARSHEDDLGDTFADKTFQITFRVSPPVLSDWQAFLGKQLRSAFPSHTGEDFHAIYRMYDLKRLAGVRPPTPRDIKIFINRIGAIHRQWQDQIPLPLQALYVLLVRDATDLDHSLAYVRDEVLLRPVPVQLVGPDWRNAVSAIHYNVELGKALQVAVGEPIRAALVEGNSEKLKGLQELKGFSHVLERVVEGNQQAWVGKESKHLAMAASALAQLKTGEDPSFKRTWQMLSDGAGQVKAWTDIDDAVAHGIVRVFEHRPSEDLARNLVASLAQPTPKGGEAAAIEGWLSGVAIVLRALFRQFAPVVESQFAILGSVGDYIQVLRVLGARSDLNDIAPLCKPTVSRAKIISTIAAEVDVGAFYEIVEAVLAVGGQWPWEDLLVAVEARLRTNGQIQPTEMRVFTQTLFVLARTEPRAGEILKSLTTDGFMAHHLHFARTARDNDAIALLVLAMLEYLPGGAVPNPPSSFAVAGANFYRQVLNSPASEPEVLGRFLEYVRTLGKVDMLFDLPTQNPASRELVSMVLRTLAEQPDPHRSISPAKIVTEYELLQSALGTDLLRQLVERSTSESKLREEILGYQFHLPLAPLYLTVFLCAGEQEAYKQFLVEGLRSISKEQWEEELGSEGAALELVLELADRAGSAGQDLGLTTAFQDALLAHSQKLINGSTVSRLKARWPRILFVLNAASRGAFLYKLSDLLCDAATSTNAVLELYGSDLARSSALVGNRERFVMLALSKMLERKNVGELNWVGEALDATPELLQVSTSARADLLERLQNAKAEDLDPAVGQAVGRIARHVEPPAT